jgi:hypothetical protein
MLCNVDDNEMVSGMNVEARAIMATLGISTVDLHGAL